MRECSRSHRNIEGSRTRTISARFIVTPALRACSKIAISTIWRCLKRLGYSHKKRSVGAAERDEFTRAAWGVMVADQIDADRFVFVDEMGSDTSLYPLRAWAPSGDRARCSVPRNRGKNTTLVASITIEGMGPALAIEGSTDALVFETYVEQFLVPTLKAGRVMVMDNLNAHSELRWFWPVHIMHAQTIGFGFSGTLYALAGALGPATLKSAVTCDLTHILHLARIGLKRAERRAFMKGMKPRKPAPKR